MDAPTIFANVYAAFNARDISAALVLMAEDVSWPKASEGGRVVGKEEIRAYWTRQWSEFDPHVEPVEIVDRGAGHFDVRVHQVVKTRSGDVLFDGNVCHTYRIADGLIQRMDVSGGSESPSAAFTHGSR